MKKILVVDDKPDLRKLLAIVLRRDGRQIITAGNGEQAVESALESRPDLILLDLMMPGRWDGMDVIRKLKQMPETAGAKIIVMTANASEDSKREVLVIGADIFISKPFNIEDLQRKVKMCLQGPVCANGSVSVVFSPPS